MVTIGIDIILKYQEKKLESMEIIDEGSGMPYTLETYLSHSLLPTPIGEMPLCAEQGFDAIPWYCKGLLTDIQSLYIAMAGFAIQEAFVLIGLVLLADAFVTFCTGKFNKSGKLVPQPFLQRWVLGISVKLLTNPLSKPAATFILNFTLKAGPSRVVRWYLAFLGPMVEMFLWNIWIAFARSRNAK